MLWNLIYVFQGIHLIATKLGQHEAKRLRMLNCERIFDILNGLAVARQQINGKKSKQEVCYNFCIH